MELLIVIVVIGILAAIVIVAYNGVTRRAYETAIKSDLRGAASTLELDNMSGNHYPWSGAAANDGQGLKSSPGNALTYVPKPYGYCVQGSHPSVPTSFAIRSNTGTIADGTCNAMVSTPAGSASGHQDGPASTAQFAFVYGLVFDATGNLYIGDCSGSNGTAAGVGDRL